MTFCSDVRPYFVSKIRKNMNNLLPDDLLCSAKMKLKLLFMNYRMKFYNSPGVFIILASKYCGWYGGGKGMLYLQHPVGTQH